ncbi:PT domain-containing protein [Herpetosiphon giganteus]|uniref:PT domain-containing protein n=1 Tax=Herpetosiphon giganteus TaxID=2029754 RepID=UPI0019567F90|nr:PT domain-containing protein [Herpetosiphon giganteus]MBM7846637.1 hypothetical protein [Herpetosiphon giganteus]
MNDPIDDSTVIPATRMFKPIITKGRRFAFERGLVGASLAFLIPMLLGSVFDGLDDIIDEAYVILIATIPWTFIWMAWPRRSWTLFIGNTGFISLFLLMYHNALPNGFEPAFIWILLLLVSVYGIVGSWIVEKVWKDTRNNDETFYSKPFEFPSSLSIILKYGLFPLLLCIIVSIFSDEILSLNILVYFFISFSLIGLFVSVLRYDGRMYMLSPLIVFPIINTLLAIASKKIEYGFYNTLVMYFSPGLIFSTMIAIIIVTRSNPDTETLSYRKQSIILLMIYTTYLIHMRPSILQVENILSLIKEVVIVGFGTLSIQWLISKTKIGQREIAEGFLISLPLLGWIIFKSMIMINVLNLGRSIFSPHYPDVLIAGPTLPITVGISLLLIFIVTIIPQIQQRSATMTPEQRKATGLGILAVLAGIAYISARMSKQMSKQISIANKRRQAEFDAMHQEMNTKLQQASQPVSPPISQPVSPPISQPVSPPISQPVSPPEWYSEKREPDMKARELDRALKEEGAAEMQYYRDKDSSW